MKSSNTLLLSKKRLLKLFITLLVSLYANVSQAQLDLRTCGYNCTSNNYTLTDVFLSLTDVYGVPITNTTCTIGNVQQVYILLNYTSNSNSNIHFTRFFADLSIDGVVTPLNVPLGTIAPGGGQVHLYGPFNWTCGQELLLNNILVAWRTSSNQDPGPNYTCNSYSNSQCDFSPNMVISKPLAVQFTYVGCTNGNQSTIQFTSTTNGGIPPYSYAWDFDNNGTTDSTIANPSHTYSLPGNYTAKLTVTDSQGLVNSYLVPIVFPSEITLSANITNLSCAGGNTGAIDLSVSGGTAPYTYLWSNGATSQDISNLPAGSYTVTVKDAINCTKSATYVIAGGDTTPPVVTAPIDITLEGCNESAIPDLPFSTTEVVITLAQLQALGGNATDNSGGNLIISYIDVKSGSCPIVITRTFYAKDACNNVGSDTQIINIDDTVAPALPSVLPQNVTVSCDNVPANSSLTANDTCSGSITVQGVDSITSSACGSEYSISRLWTFTDACGNSSSHTQVITVQDTTAPTFNGQVPGPITVQCDNVPAPVALTASDNCDNNVQVIYSESFAGQNDGCSANYTITRNWSVTDCAGNNTQHTQIVTVQDTTAPTFNGQLPANATVQCDNVPAPVVLTASDNCDNSVQVVYSETFAGQNDGCSANFVITRNWSVTDCAGNNTQHTQIVTVQDTTAPTFNGQVPGNITVQCDNVPAPVVLTASDNCDNSVQVVYSETFAGQNDVCSANYVITRNWSVTDCAGNNTQHTQIVTVQDTTAPTFNGQLPANATVQCDNVPAPVVLTASDNCDNSVQVVYSETFAGQNDGCSANYVITRNWSVTDCAGNNTQHTQIVTVQDTTAPTFNGQVPGDITVQCDNVPTPVVLTASDNCDNSVQVVYSETLAGQNDGCSANYVITRNWSVTDCAGNNTQHTQIVTVQDTVAPTFNGQVPGDITVQCDSVPAPVVLTASDNCDNSVSVVYSESFDGQQDGCSANYIITRNWSVTDCAGNNTQHTQIVTVQDTVAPTFNGQLPANVTVQCDSVPAPVVLTASDNCDNSVSVVYSESFDGQQDGCSANYVITRNWSVIDCAGNNTQHTQIVTVQDTTAPIFSGQLPGDITVQCDSVPAPVVLTASDNCDNSVQVVYSETFQGQDDNCVNNYVITRNWSVTDCAGNNTQHTQIVTVQDTTAPTFNGQVPGDITVQCDSVPAPVVLTASDNCDNSVQVAYTESFEGQNDNCGDNYVITRNWSVTDCAGNNTQHTQIVTVQDTTAPTFNGEVPGDITVQCDSVPSPVVLTASDNCDNSVQVAYTETFQGQDDNCVNNYVITRNWSVTDCAGNNTQHTQIVTVQDTTAPTFNGEVPSDVTVQCDTVPAPIVLTASDNCDNSVQVVYTESFEGQNDNCGDNYIITRNWSVTDCAGNNTQHTQIVTVQDITAPTFNGEVPSDVTVQCDNVPAPVVLTASDNCDNSVVVVYTESFSGQDDECSSNYIITRNWSVTDCAGNNTQHIQIVTVIDTTAPVFNGEVPGNITVQCDNIPEPVILVATDNCDNNIQVIYTETFEGQDDGCSANYIITRNWTVTDCAGNITKHIQLVTVEDTTPPLFNGELPGPITVQCDSVPSPVVLTASDNCDNNVQVVYTETFDGQQDNCGANYVITRNWSVTDCAGNNTQHTQIVTVQDTTAPTFNTEGLPGDITVQCDSVPAPVVLTASDNCDNSVQVVYTESFDGQQDNCGANYVITRNWSVTDCAGNNTQHTQIVTVQDTTAPVFNIEGLPGDITVQCDSVPTPVVITASDNCDNTVQVIFNEERRNNEGSCLANYTLIRTWTATDCAGNSVSHIQTINVQDTIAPIPNVEIPPVLNVNCSEIPPVPEIIFTDNCSTNVTVVYTEATTDQTEYGYVIIRHWVVTDQCGNRAEFNQVINVTIDLPFSYVTGSVCNGDAPVDLFSFLPQGTETTGVWVDVNNTGGLSGSILNPAGIPAGFYVYRYTISDGPCPRIIEVYMTIDDDCIVLPCTINDMKISKVVTPGDDGHNDFFRITGLETCGFTYDVKIFNRWGALLYENPNYQNNWSGIADQAISSSNLPAGTYYYIVNIVNSGFDIFNGYFYLGTKN